MNLIKSLPLILVIILSYQVSFATSSPVKSKVEEEVHAELNKNSAEENHKVEIKVKDATPIVPAPAAAVAADTDKSDEQMNQKEQEVAHAAHHEVPTGVAPEKALGWLKNGNTRFIKGRLRNDGQGKKDIQRLSSAQNPHTIVLSCSDSRVPPEVVFDQKLGEIFVVRTAGEALDNAALGSIEYAVDHLGPKLILVMGHESCGAVKAALATLGGQDAGSPALNALVKDIHPRLNGSQGKEASHGFISEAKANASGVAKDLVGRSKIIEAKISSGQLRIETAIYHLSSGVVEFY